MIGTNLCGIVQQIWSKWNYIWKACDDSNNSDGKHTELTWVFDKSVDTHLSISHAVES